MAKAFFIRSLLLSSAGLCLATPAFAQSGPLAGPKPIAQQTGRSAGCLGDVQLGSNIGSPRVANGFRVGQSWQVDLVTSTPAICSFPSARPVDVACVRDGRQVDTSYCQDSQFQELLNQGYKTVGNSRDWATAQWLLPGETDSGCIGEWRSQDGNKPMGCGEVDVPVVSTCAVTNVQSGTPDDPSKYCTSAPPAASRKDTDYRACGFAIETGGWGPYSAECGEASHERSLTCRRSDGTAMSMSDSNCASALQTYCSTHTCVGSGDSTREREVVTRGACSADPRFSWRTGNWASGGQTCGDDTQTRAVFCYDDIDKITVSDESCSGLQRPAASRTEYVTSGCSTQTNACFGAWGYINYGRGNPQTDTVEITADKIWTSGDPTWYVWAGGKYNTYDAFQLSRKNKSSTPAMIFAVPPGAKLTIYSGPNQTGSVLKEVVGPKIIQRGVSGWLTESWSDLPIMKLFPPSTRSDESNASQPLLGNYGGSFEVQCGTPTPSPTPTPTPTPTCTPPANLTDEQMVCATSYSENSGEAGSTSVTTRNSWSDEQPNLLRDTYAACVANGSTCVDVHSRLVDQEQNSYYYETKMNCHGGPVQDPSGGTCTPTPAPTPTPTPGANPTPIAVGWCRYTSSGNGRYACGEYGAATHDQVGAASPSQLCTGSLIAGVLNMNTPGDVPYSYAAGRGWTANPPAAHVDGAQCIIRWRVGYSDSDSTAVIDAYFDGPPTGRAGGIWKAPKP